MLNNGMMPLCYNLSSFHLLLLLGISSYGVILVSSRSEPTLRLKRSLHNAEGQAEIKLLMNWVKLLRQTGVKDENGTPLSERYLRQNDAPYKGDLETKGQNSKHNIEKVAATLKMGNKQFIAPQSMRQNSARSATDYIGTWQDIADDMERAISNLSPSNDREAHIMIQRINEEILDPWASVISLRDQALMRHEIEDDEHVRVLNGHLGGFQAVRLAAGYMASQHGLNADLTEIKPISVKDQVSRYHLKHEFSSLSRYKMLRLKLARSFQTANAKSKLAQNQLDGLIDVLPVAVDKLSASDLGQNLRKPGAWLSDVNEYEYDERYVTDLGAGQVLDEDGTDITGDEAQRRQFVWRNVYKSVATMARILIAANVKLSPKDTRATWVPHGDMAELSEVLTSLKRAILARGTTIELLGAEASEDQESDYHAHRNNFNQMLEEISSLVDARQNPEESKTLAELMETVGIKRDTTKGSIGPFKLAGQRVALKRMAGVKLKSAALKLAKINSRVLGPIGDRLTGIYDRFGDSKTYTTDEARSDIASAFGDLKQKTENFLKVRQFQPKNGLDDPEQLRDDFIRQCSDFDAELVEDMRSEFNKITLGSVDRDKKLTTLMKYIKNIQAKYFKTNEFEALARELDKFRVFSTEYALRNNDDEELDVLESALTGAHEALNQGPLSSSLGSIVNSYKEGVKTARSFMQLRGRPTNPRSGGPKRSASRSKSTKRYNSRTGIRVPSGASASLSGHRG